MAIIEMGTTCLWTLFCQASPASSRHSLLPYPVALFGVRGRAVSLVIAIFVWCWHPLPGGRRSDQPTRPTRASASICSQLGFAFVTACRAGSSDPPHSLPKKIPRPRFFCPVVGCRQRAVDSFQLFSAASATDGKLVANPTANDRILRETVRPPTRNPSPPRLVCTIGLLWGHH